MNLRLDSKFIIPVIVATVIFMEFLDITIINTAIPSIAQDFNLSPLFLKYAVASYFLSLAIFIPISSYVADRFGTKKTFLLAVSIFTLASTLCGFTSSIISLTTLRFIQGIGGAFMNPVSRIVILRIFPAKDLVKIQSIIFTPALLGYVLGPFTGGILCNYLSWHWIFWINLPVGILTLILGQKHIIQFISYIRPQFDTFGFILAGVALVLITLFTEMLNHYDILSKAAVYMLGMVGIGLFISLIFYCYTHLC